MGYRIESRLGAPSFPKQKSKKEATYIAFLHRLPCITTGRYGVEAAHLSYANSSLGHYGRGRGTKAPDRWALPLAPEEHRYQHAMNEREFWENRGINPHLVALAIWGLWTELGDDAEPFAVSVIQGWERLPW